MEFGACFAGFAVGGLAAEKASLDEHLEPFRPFLGKTWKGHFKNSTPEKPQVDVARWERALNGKAVRVLHSINDGVYGGESIIVWDEKKKSLVYYYFTTAGFYTTGTMTLSDGKYASHEVVTGSAEGVTEVKATGELRADGTMHSKSEYLKEGKWVSGHEVTCKEDPKAEVVFKRTPVPAEVWPPGVARCCARGSKEEILVPDQQNTRFR